MTVPQSSTAFANTPVPEGVCKVAEHAPVRYLQSHAVQLDDTDIHVSLSASQWVDGSIDAVGQDYDEPAVWIEEIRAGDHLPVESIVLSMAAARQLAEQLHAAIAQLDAWVDAGAK